MVQTLTLDTANETLAYGIGFRCLNRRPELFNLPVFRYTRETMPVLAVIVPDQKAGSFLVRSGFSHLLGDPEATR